ncbi:hypothetical protein HNR06_001472 [Nocardiopsis arvandica]|uniref:Uncharacterized protein n=1 Tax=Nocardiopsis sinuspersici TaxID=501010 RepID=A0A7Y9XC73_9ACTN|nr:hypothetical protein [Nocardiopsis sinuspersici]
MSSLSLLYWEPRRYRGGLAGPVHRPHPRSFVFTN